MAIFKLFTALAFMSVINLALTQNQNQNQTVTYCPLYLVLQNRCPTPSTTLGTTQRPSSGADSEVVEDCGQVTFCPAMQVFLTEGNCSEGQTVQVRITNLARLLTNPSTENAAATVGSAYVDALGDTLTSISKTIQANPTQATIGVTFIPVGQIVGK